LICFIGQIHPDAKELFNVNGNLRKVCETLKNPEVRINEIEISLFNPFKPVNSINED
jgi:DNA ligase-4